MGLLVFAAGVATGYGIAQALLARERLPEEVPAQLREPLTRAQARLRRLRARAMLALDEAERARREATVELEADYHRRVGRQG